MDTVLIDKKSNDGLIKVNITANREQKGIVIDDRLLENRKKIEES